MANIIKLKTAVSFYKSNGERRQDSSPNKSFYSKSGIQEYDRVTVNRSSLLALQNSGASLPSVNPPNLTLALQKNIGNSSKRVVIQVGTPQEAIRIKRRLMTNESMISGASYSNRHNRSQSVQHFERGSGDHRQDFFSKRRSVPKYDE